MFGRKKYGYSGSKKRTTYDYDNSRSCKPQGEGAGYSADTDYSRLIMNAVRAPGNANSVRDLYDARMKKALGTPALNKYANDEIMQAAREYMKRQRELEKKDSRVDTQRDELLNRSEFKYNAESDPLYKQYADIYKREGGRAMADTLGAVAANTGGLASSYAAGAANQAYNNYAARQADIIPELQQLAYEKHLNDIRGKRDDYSMLYGESRDALDDFRYDTEFRENARRLDDEMRFTTEQAFRKQANEDRDFEREGKWHDEETDYKNRVFDEEMGYKNRVLDNEAEANKFDQAVTLIKLGASNKEIASRLKVSEREAAEIVRFIVKYMYS